MQTRTLGAAALKVSALGLGCMGMTLGYGPAKPKEEMKSLIHEAFDLGVTFFDTAGVRSSSMPARKPFDVRLKAH